MYPRRAESPKAVCEISAFVLACHTFDKQTDEFRKCNLLSENCSKKIEGQLLFKIKASWKNADKNCFPLEM